MSCGESESEASPSSEEELSSLSNKDELLSASSASSLSSASPIRGSLESFLVVVLAARVRGRFVG